MTTQQLPEPLEYIAQSEAMLNSNQPPYYNNNMLRTIRSGDQEYNIGPEDHGRLWITIERKTKPLYRIENADFFNDDFVEVTLVSSVNARKQIDIRIWKEGEKYKRYKETKRNKSAVGIESIVPFSLYWERSRPQHFRLGQWSVESSCTFCEEGDNGILIVNNEPQGNRTIYHTENFIVQPTLGPIKEGHVLIITKNHRLNIGDIPQSMHPELEEVIATVTTSLQRVYGSQSLFFEHGPTTQNRAGCCIDHAHIHAVPIEGPLRTWIPKQAREIKELTALSKLYCNNIPYLFFQENNGTRYVIELTYEVQSQYIRRMIVQHAEGQPDWRQNLNLPCVFATYEKMRRAMQL
ncbi:MAG: HIT domain-containing protein [Candidatus Woesearchaeota archaeon]|jgi:diadenosine tetraphosphate (Ap4A) HIT family hydrolase